MENKRIRVNSVPNFKNCDGKGDKLIFEKNGLVKVSVSRYLHVIVSGALKNGKYIVVNLKGAQGEFSAL